MDNHFLSRKETVMNTPEVSVIMPCLNEERTIGTCIKKCKEVFLHDNIAGEVIVIDNGSSDGTSSVAVNENARVVPHGIRGYGSALMRGIAESRGQYIIMADGDDTYSFSDISKFLIPLRSGADLVMGSRLIGIIEPHAMPWLHRYVGTPFLTKVINTLFGTSISDINCGMRGFSKTAIEKMCLERPGMEFAAEMIIKASVLKLKIEEIPINYRIGDPERKPHVRAFRDGWRHLRFMILAFLQYGMPAKETAGIGN
jgi:glycosyltransferase involved in cell wall biosynthesis